MCIFSVRRDILLGVRLGLFLWFILITFFLERVRWGEIYLRLEGRKIKDN